MLFENAIIRKKYETANLYLSNNEEVHFIIKFNSGNSKNGYIKSTKITHETTKTFFDISFKKILIFFYFFEVNFYIFEYI